MRPSIRSLLLLAAIALPGTAAAQGNSIPGTQGNENRPRGREAYIREVRQEVRVTLALLLDAMERGDVDRLARLYERDGAIVYPDGETVRTQDAIRERLPADLRRMPNFRVQESEMETSGDMAVLMGMYVYDDRGGAAPVTRLGNITLILWRGREREWRIRYMVLGGPPAPAG
ncbi:MAG TPA: nuclear transport factor 2 family protein [Longimicrobium sp.]|nr:nuclear transport factor 2 family protein [Longimicrobium sp.]